MDSAEDRAGKFWPTRTESGLDYGFNRDNLGRMVTAACEEAGVERIVPYELRHTAITFQLDPGHEVWQVAVGGWNRPPEQPKVS